MSAPSQAESAHPSGQSVPGELARAGFSSHAMEDQLRRFAIGWRTPQAVVDPETPEQVAALLALAAGRGWSVVPWGAGQDMACGRTPARYDLALSLHRLRNVVDHDVENLTVTAQAGLPLAEANRRVGPAHQFLALGFDTEPRTLGGMIAANRPVPRRLLYGDMRDQLLGVAVATPQGRLVRYGRKVIKNVAGYDMNKLYAGSAGMLGVIVEATFKLFALPDERAIAAADFGGVEETGAFAAAAELYRSPLAPAFLALKGHAGGLTRLSAGFEGRSPGVRRQTSDALALMARYGGTGGRVQPGIPSASGLSAASQDGGVRLRAGAAPGRLASWAEEARRVAHGLAASVALEADYGAGLLCIGLSSISAGDAYDRLKHLRTALEAERGYLLVERAPEGLMEALGPWGELGGEAALMRSLRRQMDPNEILNPGRYL